MNFNATSFCSQAPLADLPDCMNHKGWRQKLKVRSMWTCGSIYINYRRVHTYLELSTNKIEYCNPLLSYSSSLSSYLGLSTCAGVLGLLDWLAGFGLPPPLASIPASSLGAGLSRSESFSPKVSGATESLKIKHKLEHESNCSTLYNPGR